MWRLHSLKLINSIFSTFFQLKNTKSTSLTMCQDDNYVLMILLCICLIIVVLIFPILGWFIFAYYSQKKLSKISEDPNNSENTINEQNNGDLVGEYGSKYGGDNFEESGVSGNMDLAEDYGGGVYGGNYSSGNELGSGVYGEGGNSESCGNT